MCQASLQAWMHGFMLTNEINARVKLREAGKYLVHECITFYCAEATFLARALAKALNKVCLDFASANYERHRVSRMALHPAGSGMVGCNYNYCFRKVYFFQKRSKEILINFLNALFFPEVIAIMAEKVRALDVDI